MEEAIPISTINDFIFCARSIYFHSVYQSFSDEMYHQSPQVEGRLNHDVIDTGKYSSKKDILQGMAVYSEQYGIIGKIDLYDSVNRKLIERKTRIKRVHNGYRYQLYGQYYAMMEMGFPVESLELRSLRDNKRYAVPIPSWKEELVFRTVLDGMRHFSMQQSEVQYPEKCAHCIYRELCKGEII